MSARKCNARSKRTGEPCRANAVTGSEKCYHHGGATPRGVALPQTKTGRWSRDLPTRLGERYAEALADAKLLELRDELAVIDARLSDLLATVDTGEAGAHWSRLKDAAHEYRNAQQPAKQAAALITLLELISRGAAEWQTWEDIFRTIERRARLAESERRRLVEMQQMMSSEQAMTLLAAVVDTIRRHVSDRDALRGISADLGRILAPGAGAAN